VAEGIARVARVVAAVGSKYSVIAGRSKPIHRGDVDQRIRTPVRALLRRGIDDGTFRGEYSVEDLTYLFGGLLQAGARLAAQGQIGVERTAALVTSVFLHGTESRKAVAS